MINYKSTTACESLHLGQFGATKKVKHNNETEMMALKSSEQKVRIMAGIVLIFFHYFVPHDRGKKEKIIILI